MPGKIQSYWPLIIAAGFAVVVAVGVSAQRRAGANKPACPLICWLKGGDSQQMAEEPMKKKLTPMQYEVTQCGATEPPFTGKYYNFHGEGKYRCIVCGNELFTSDTKFDSGTGWPSFSAPVDDNSVREKTDTSHSMVRTEVLCSKCGAHLGHVFNDGPEPMGLRYCINSAALDFAGQDANSK